LRETRPAGNLRMYRVSIFQPPSDGTGAAGSDVKYLSHGFLFTYWTTEQHFVGVSEYFMWEISRAMREFWFINSSRHISSSHVIKDVFTSANLFTFKSHILTKKKMAIEETMALNKRFSFVSKEVETFI
jgi:hypothetical protein